MSSNTFPPSVQNSSIEMFINQAEFVRYHGKRKLWIKYGCSLLDVRDQKYGKLTLPVEDVLRNVFNRYNKIKTT